MRSPAAAFNRSRSQIGRRDAIPAPTRGWNARDPLAKMRPDEAVVLDNWIPRPADVEARKGYASHVTGFASAVLTLMPYNAPSGTSSLWAATAGGIYNVTAAGAVGASAIALTNGRMQFTQQATAAGSYLVAVNGVDTLKLYDGSTWASITGVSTPAITGVATSELVNVVLFAQRLFFIRTNSLSLYYLPVDAVGGALVEYPLRSYLKRGGYLTAAAAWSLDAGEGADDHLVVLSSEGELAVFKGTDPSSSTSWRLVGVWYLGKPLGRRSLFPYGGDVIALVQGGIKPLSKSLVTGNLKREAALSDRISNAFTEAAKLYYNNLGWAGEVFDLEGLLIINVPTGTNTAVQYVMTNEGAWCRFTGLEANCWATLGAELFYGGATTVNKALTGGTDNGGNRTMDCQMAYNYLGGRGSEVHLDLVRPLFSTIGDVGMLLGVTADFVEEVLVGSTTTSTIAGSLWDTALWDSGIWGAESTVVGQWQQVPGPSGKCLSLRMRVASQSASLSWVATDVIVGKGQGGL